MTGLVELLGVNQLVQLVHQLRLLALLRIQDSGDASSLFCISGASLGTPLEADYTREDDSRYDEKADPCLDHLLSPCPTAAVAAILSPPAEAAT
jgi:hypothetical protein